MRGNKLLNGDAIPKSAEVTGVEGLPGPSDRGPAEPEFVQQMTRDHRLYACRKHALVNVFLGRPAGCLQRVAIAKLIVDRLIFPVERLKVLGEETVCPPSA